MPVPPPVPRYPVAAPAGVARPFGLLSVAAEGAGSSGAGPAPWERGVSYHSSSCNLLTGTVDGVCHIPDDTIVDISAFQPVYVEGAPFTVTSGLVCVAPSFDAEAEALAQLTRGEAYQVERRFYTDTTSSDLYVPLGRSGSVDCALGLLEEYAAIHYAGQPIIHAPLQLVGVLFRDGKVIRDGDRITTQWGTPVALGAGYQSDGLPTLLVTGQVTAWKSDPFVNTDFSTKTNERSAIAERTYAITSDCLAAGVVVDACGQVAE